MAVVGALLIETRSFRPFKSSEEYLFAMKEDLAEWLGTLYPELRINPENFMDRLDTGVALCRHANAVREFACRLLSACGAPPLIGQALELAQTLYGRAPVTLLAAARPGTFFARDNVSNFIHWCRGPLGVLECLLFETDDLILRKNEKHVVLCLLEVARRGAELGMPAPLLVLMERQIDRELAGESDCGELGLTPAAPAVSACEPSAPGGQLVTNDLRSLDERVRDALGACTCPTQFPMTRVSDGKYRIGDTKILIFVRILRSHVMVRVGGGWDTLGHYLDKHDPCRCRAAHRAAVGARLVRPAARAPDLDGAAVHYVRAPAPAPAPPPGSNRRSASPAVHRRASSPQPVFKAEPKPTSRDSSRNGSPTGTPVSLRRTNKATTVPAPSQRSGSPAGASRENSPPESDNGSEISDEGYRSLGIAQMSPATAPTAPSTMAFSRPVANDAEEHECLVRLERETSVDEDVSLTTGLRKTDYSLQLYYGENKTVKCDEQPHSLFSTMPREDGRLSEQESRCSNEKDSRCSVKKESRNASKVEKSPSNKSSPSKSPKAHNTWSGGKGARVRPRIDDSTFSPPSARNIAAARSSSRARPSPPLLQQLLQTAEDAADDAAILEKMKQLIEQYSPPVTPTAHSPLAKERKDTRNQGTISKIPAPVRR